jgi:hypothetical protein
MRVVFASQPNTVFTSQPDTVIKIDKIVLRQMNWVDMEGLPIYSNNQVDTLLSAKIDVLDNPTWSEIDEILNQ